MCEYADICWRYIYSKDLEEREDKSSPHTRLELLLLKKIPPSIYPRGGIYAEHFPHVSQDGVYTYVCPFIETGNFLVCPEYLKEYRKRNRNKPRNSKFDRSYIPKEIRRSVAESCHYICSYCGRAINSADENGKKLRGVIDHIIPLAKGGTSDIENLTLSCWECNSKKGDALWPKPNLQTFSETD